MSFTENYFNSVQSLTDRIMHINTLCCNVDINQEFWRDISHHDIDYDLTGKHVIVKTRWFDPYDNWEEHEVYTIPPDIINSGSDQEIVEGIMNKIKQQEQEYEKQYIRELFNKLMHDNSNHFIDWFLQNEHCKDWNFDRVYSLYKKETSVEKLETTSSSENEG